MTRSTAWTRRTALAGAGAAALGAVAVAGCTDDSTDGDQQTGSDLGATPRTLAATSAPPLQAPDDDDPGRIEAPEGIFRLSGVLRTASFTPEQVQRMLQLSQAPSEDVRAPDGQEFLLASFARTPVTWPFVTNDLDYSSTVQILTRSSSDGSYETTPVSPSEVEQVLLMRVPEEALPEDAMLEVVIAKRTQRVSLIDGSLQQSDVGDLERRSASTVDAATGEAVDGSAVIQVERPAGSGNSDVLWLSVQEVQLTPMTPHVGWPDPGQQLLGVVLRPEQWFARSDDKRLAVPARPGRCRLTAPGQDSVKPLEVQRLARYTSAGLFRSDTYALWFAVGADIEQAQLDLSLAPYPRTDELEKAGSLGHASIDLQFSTDPVPTP